MLAQRRVAAMALAILICALVAHGAAPPSLGDAAPFVILGGTSVINSGTSRINGLAGASPGRTVSGLTSSMFVAGWIASASESARARVDADRAADALDRSGCTGTTLTEPPGGRTLGPGVWCIDAAAVALEGTLILDAAGDRDAVWIFRITGALVTAPASRVLVVNGGCDGNVFWRTASATLGADSVFVGNLFASTDITLQRGARMSGRALAHGAVSLDSSTVSLCCEPITLAPATLPVAVVSTEYRQQLKATGGFQSYSFEGAAPAGLSVSGDGVLSGRPASAGRFTFIVTATDEKGCVGAALYVLDVTCPIVILPDVLPPANACDYGRIISPFARYTQQFRPDGDAPPFTCRARGPLTGDVQLPECVLSVIPAEPGEFPIEIIATDALGRSCSRTYILDVACPAIVPGDLPNGTVGEKYDAIPTVAECPGLFAFTYTGTPPPAIPTKPGRYRFEVTATAANGCRGTRAYAVAIDCPTFDFSPDDLPPADVGVAYSVTLSATGAIGSHVFAVLPPSRLPAGLMLVDGAFRGAPTELGTFVFVVKATDTISGCEDTIRYRLLVRSAPMTSTPPVIPALSPWAFVAAMFAMAIVAMRRIR